MSKLKENKLGIIIGSLAVIVLIGIVYAVFTQTLTINGTADVRDSKWDIHIVEEGQLDPTYITGSAKVLTKPTASTTSISDFALSLTTPGDTIEYTFHVINEGDYDAEISDLDKNGPICTANGSTSDPEAVKVCNKLEYTLKYDNGSDVTEGDTILSKETKTMVLAITYEEFDDPSLLPTTNVSISGLGIYIQYSQKGNAKVNADGTTPYDPYPIGTEVTIQNEKYNVIGQGDDYVTLLKQEPLTTTEINIYGGAGTANNHVNKYTQNSVGTAYDWNDTNHTGGMAYYSSSTCGYSNPGDNSTWTISGCATDYATSEVKYVVDAWAQAKFTNGEIKTVDGYGARLATKEELQPIGWPSCNLGDEQRCPRETDTPRWICNINYIYWTMSQWGNSDWNVLIVDGFGDLEGFDVKSVDGAVRPVINFYKSAIEN